MITNIQKDIDLSSIENIESISTQKAILETIMEFLFLEYGNHDYMDDYEDIFDYFSVNRKGIREIQDGIDAMYESMGIQGIAEHYSFGGVAVKAEDNTPEAKEDTMLSRAEKAFLDYKMKDAYGLFSYLAEQGIGRAMYFMGEFYSCGYAGVVERDHAKAKEWRQKGADAGDVLSYLNCAYSSSDEKEKKDIFKDVFNKVLALAQQGDVFAMREVADMFADGYGTRADDEKEIYWLHQSASYWKSMYKIGNIEFNRGDYKTAVAWYSKAAEKGYELGETWLGYCYRNGYGVSIDKKKAFKLYLSAAQKGESYAQLMVGAAYDFQYEEFGVEQDVEKGHQWYEIAGKNGQSGAYQNLAFDAPFFSRQRIEYLRKGAALGNDDCTIELAKDIIQASDGSSEYKDELWSEFGEDANKYRFNTHDTRQPAVIQKYGAILQKYAEGGNARAQYYMGMLYQYKDFLGKDLSLSQSWLQKAAQQGHKHAQAAYQGTECHIFPFAD